MAREGRTFNMLNGYVCFQNIGARRFSLGPYLILRQGVTKTDGVAYFSPCSISSCR
jgi:hypothetical protein